MGNFGSMRNYEGYLQLHAERAPRGPYVGEYSEENDPDSYAYHDAVEQAVRNFEREHHVTLYLLGRSGRHVCIEDTPQNRFRFRRLQRSAIRAAHDLWDMMRSPEHGAAWEHEQRETWANKTDGPPWFTTTP